MSIEYIKLFAELGWLKERIAWLRQSVEVKINDLFKFYFLVFECTCSFVKKKIKKRNNLKLVPVSATMLTMTMRRRRRSGR